MLYNTTKTKDNMLYNVNVTCYITNITKQTCYNIT